MTDLRIQDGEILQAWRTGEGCEYQLSSVLPTMQVLGRAQESMEKAES
jgi:hypothetical protein